MDPSLHVTGLTMTIRDGLQDRTLLDDVSFRVDAGTLTAITGRSGSGKTTLLTIVGLLRRPPAGEVSVAGAATSALNDRQRTRLRRQHVAIIYQSANLLPALTALEQLELVGRIRGENRRTVRREAVGLLDQVGLSPGAHGRLPRALSGGERQRVGIARALIARPAVLIADEPTASLDPDRGRDIAALLATHTRERGIATLLVSHDRVPLEQADQRLQLVDGALTAGDLTS